MLGGMGPHQFQILNGVAGGRKRGRGFDEIHFGARRDAAGNDLQLVSEIGVLKNHFEQGALFMAFLSGLQQLHLDVLKLAREQLRNIQHHVDFLGAAPQHIANFIELNGCCRGAVGKARQATDRYARAAQCAHSLVHVTWTHTDAGYLIALGQFAARDHLLVGQLGPHE